MIHRASHSARRAFTLIEAMSAVVVLSTLGSISSFLILDAVDGYTEAVTSAQLHAEMSITLDRVTRELRGIVRDTGAAGPGPAPHIESTTASLVDWKDTDDDDYRLLWDNTDNELELSLDGGGPTILQKDVTNCVISTYDEDNTQLGWTLAGAACDPIRRIMVELTCERNGVTQVLRTKVYVRSTMDGS